MVASEALEKQLGAIRSMRRASENLRSQEPPSHMASTWARTVLNGTRHWSNEIKILERAQPFLWTRQTTAAVLAAAPAFHLPDITCHREVLFCDFGFCWFEEAPFEIQMRENGSDRIQGLSWAYVRERQSQVAMITVTAYGLSEGGLPKPVTWASVSAGRRFNEFGAPSDATSASAAEFDRWQRQCEELVRFVVCAGVFLRQKLASVEEVRAERHARKRIAAAGWAGEPTVSVVHLREREKSPKTSGDANDPENARTYQYQWIVQAHTRQQWYPSLGTHLPILIGPYIKGPEDKPLKPRSTPIFLVDR